MKKYGFIYLWFDKKHRRFYLGCHWGSEDDGYICSSRWMRQAFKRRPQDFKRRIISRVHSSRADLLVEEGKWLSLIDDDHISSRYYNLTKHTNGHWTTDPQKRLTVGQKISIANKGRPSAAKGVPCPEERKQMLSELWKGKPKPHTRTAATRAKIAANTKRLQAEGKIGMHGKKHSDHTKQLMSKNNAMNDPINRQKISDAKRGIRHLTNGAIRKMAVPGTEKFNSLIASGYKVV